MSRRVVAATVALGALCLAGGCGGGGKTRGATGATRVRVSVSGPCRLDDRFEPGAGHFPQGRVARFRLNPPSGGDHELQPAGPGDWPADEPPSDGMVVHALEHGYVAIWYRPAALEQAQKRLLLAILAEFPRDVLLVPHPTLGVPVAATAWHHRVLCSRVDDAAAGALRAFVVRWRNHGPEAIPH
jgi:hypothetical protein